jgi:hypothetical protein
MQVLQCPRHRYRGRHPESDDLNPQANRRGFLWSGRSKRGGAKGAGEGAEKLVSGFSSRRGKRKLELRTAQRKFSVDTAFIQTRSFASTRAARKSHAGAAALGIRGGTSTSSECRGLDGTTQFLMLPLSLRCDHHVNSQPRPKLRGAAIWPETGSPFAELSNFARA